jgi:response regulator NasT
MDGVAAMKILVVDEDGERRAILRDALAAAGHEVVTGGLPATGLSRLVLDLAPDLIIIDTQSPDRDTLEHIVIISQDAPRPIVMFSSDNDTGKIREAVKAGVSAYIVDGLAASRVQPIIDVAVARFEELQSLRMELISAQGELADRKLIERAKGLLMKKKNLSEEDAFRQMRKMAMDENLKLVQVAREIVRAAKILL